MGASENTVLSAEHEAAAEDSPRVIAVEAIPWTVPYRRAARFASGAIDVADHVLVRVHTEGGLVGQAEAQPRPYTYGETQASIVRAVRDELGPRLSGVSPFSAAAASESWRDVTGDNVARGALDLAMWDLAGLIAGVPSHALLGAAHASVPVAHMVSLDEPAAMAAEAVEAAERFGVSTFKVKVGRAPVQDVAALAAIRAALPSVDLYVDANRGWSYADAALAGPQLIELGALAIEEPIDVADTAGRRRLAEAWPVPVVGDESCISLAHVERALDEGAVGFVSVKTARTGFSESREILDLCLGRGTPVVIGSQYEGAIGALATISFAAAFESTAIRAAELTNFADLADDLVAAPPDVRDGRALVPARPGLGIAVDEGKLARYRTDG